MATCYKQRYSRRRLAALNFLSSISLDGMQHGALDVKNENLTNITDPEGGSGARTVCPKGTLYYVGSACHSNLAETNNKLLNDHGNYDTCGADENIEVKDKHEQASSQFSSTCSTSTSRKNKGDDFKIFSSGVFRDRSVTLDASTAGRTMGLSKSPGNLLNLGICNPLVTTAGFPNINLHSEVLGISTESVDPLLNSAGLLLPSSSHCKKVSCNTSETSHSPTGSGTRDKEVKFLSLYDYPNQLAERRLILVTSACTPVIVFSALPFSRCQKLSRDFRGDSGRRRQTTAGVRPLSSNSDYPDLYELLGLSKPGEGQVVSYSQLLVPTHCYVGREVTMGKRRFQYSGEHFDSDFIATKSANPSGRCFSYETSGRSTFGLPASPIALATDNSRTVESDDGTCPLGIASLPTPSSYHPSLLDDPELIAGKHSTRIALLTFSSYMTSVIDYVKPSDLKKELNDKFRDKFPYVQLTLSKIRSLKREMRKVAKCSSGVDVLTVAQAYVYFERLILRGLVHKGNRKLCAGAALLLSAKMNDVKGDVLKTLIEEIQNSFRISRRELLASEFAVLVALEFSLHVPTWVTFSHYQRLLYDT